MPTCKKCTGPCNCVLSQDGFIYGGTSAENSIGRQSTDVSGSGSTDNPYLIHFMDQKEFYPRTAEFQFTNFNLSNAAGEGSLFRVADQNGATVLYQSPISFLVMHDYQYSTNTQYPEMARGSHFIIGSSVTFAEAADSVNNFRQLILTCNFKRWDGTTITKVIAAQSVRGGSGDPVSLTATGMTPISFTEPTGLSGTHHIMTLYINQNSGAALAVSNLRVWMTQI